MAISKPIILFLLLQLGSKSGLAQGRSVENPANTQQQMTVSVTLPTVVAQLSDYAQTIFSRNKGQRKTLTGKGSRTSNPVVEFTVDLPKGWGSKKATAGEEKK
ncbi:hypothetical protein SAMN06265337_0734 [Hymenobacter gelipurpurascens]|uniref:Uncharacterized protein n=1 Tax=Hymenobacter gelipurpurascens TaxID=89968 RepID=A0A212TA67_9BACT|nr:hypothetical protein [Hymenobacter gelipurpurascens]SNC62750.1 hypothetical protein SAMN06265337_0734 [Hymenobacter gelipurpurascens]